jgi:hypothetical protein
MLSVKDLGVVSGKGAHVTHAAMSRRHGLCIWAMDRIGLGTYLRLRAFRRITDEIGTAERGYLKPNPHAWRVGVLRLITLCLSGACASMVGEARRKGWDILASGQAGKTSLSGSHRCTIMLCANHALRRS